MFLGISTILCLAGAALAALPLLAPDRILPGVFAGGVYVGGKTAASAAKTLKEQTNAGSVSLRIARSAGARLLTPESGTETIDLAATELGAVLNAEKTVRAALAVGRAPGLRGLAERVSLLGTVRVPVFWSVRTEILAALLRSRFPQAFREPVAPAWELTPEGVFTYRPGGPGLTIPLDEVAAAVAERLRDAQRGPIFLRVVDLPHPAVNADGRVAGAEAARALQAPVSLLSGEYRHEIPTHVLASWFQLSPEATPSEPARLDRAAIETYLRASVLPSVTRAPTDAQLEVSGNRATAFVPPRDGVQVSLKESVAGIIRGLASGARQIALVTRPVPPTVAVTPTMEEYGIRTLLTRGESDFGGSPSNRRHNIRVGAEQYEGLLVPPGAEFSFNAYLGPVDAAHGFLPELVILHNVTTPQYGGGLCQVSTTMFRAAVRAGVPITARRNHAYAVSYYGTPGFDATIYPPNPDLRFVNDTPGHLLIRSRLEETKLAFEFWGTADGRQVEVLGPFPYDRQPDGAVKATLVRKITRGGDATREEWHSRYKSPKLFPKVLAANAETETWEERVRRISEKDRKRQEEFDRKKSSSGRSQKPSPPPGKTSSPPPPS